MTGQEVIADARGRALHTSLVDGRVAIAGYGDVWRRLAETVGSSTVFMWPAVFDAWQHELAQGVSAQVLLVHADSRLVGVLPLMRARVLRGPAFLPRIDYAPYDRDLAPLSHRPFPVRQVSSMVSWRATSLRPTLLCAPEDRTGVIAAVTVALAGMRDVDQIVLPVRAEEEATWLQGLRRAGLSPWAHDLRRKILTLEALRPFDQIVAAQSRNFRRNVARARTAAAQAGLTWSIHDGIDQVLPHLDTIARVAGESWKGKGSGDRMAIAYAGPQQRFFERLLRDRQSGLSPLLALGGCGGQTVCVALCQRHGQSLTGLLVFRTDLHPDASPGLLLLGAVIDHAAAQGIRRLDLNTTQDWLHHFADTSHLLVNVVAFRPTIRGRTWELIARARRRSLSKTST
jgi:hypothetical protein